MSTQDKQRLIQSIKDIGKGFMKNKSSIQRRINTLADIEFAAQDAREALEAALDDIEECRDPIGFGYYKAGMPFFSADEQYADRNSTCTITPLYDEEDKKIYLAGKK